MTDVAPVIADLQKKLVDQESEVRQTKQLINLLCTQYGMQPLYPDADEPDQGSQAFAPDEFYGQSLSGSMKKILNLRKTTGVGPATPREIYQSLVDGGYAFDTEVEQNRLIGIRVSLRKSSNVFHRLPDGKRYGLLEWYPKAKRKQAKQGSDDVDSSEDDLPEVENEEGPEETNDNQD